MKIDWMFGAIIGKIAIALSSVAYGQQSTPPPATDFAPAAPGAISASPTTDTAAPAAGVTSGAGAATDADDRPNEQSAEAASTGSATTNAGAGLPAPEPRTASPLDQQLGSGVDSGGAPETAVPSRSPTAGQRGELGVWLVETGGPGVRVRRVTEGSAAAQAGLQAGDVILGINGQGASSPHSVAQLIRQIQPGQAVAVQYWRNGQTNEMDILLQPVREYEVAFRGDGSMNGASRTGGDLESRTMRLEQQLATVMQELRQLRQEMMQMRGSSSGQTAVGGGGIGETSTTATGLDASTDASSATDAAATPPTTPPASTETPQNEPFGDAPATAAPESAAPAENDATPDPAPAATESDDDLFN